MFGKYSPRALESREHTITALVGINESLNSNASHTTARVNRYSGHSDHSGYSGYASASQKQKRRGSSLASEVSREDRFDKTGMATGVGAGAATGSTTVTFAEGCTYPKCKYNATGKAAVQQAIIGSSLVVVCLGLGSSVESEGRDRPNIALPEGQQALLQDAAAAAQAAGAKLVVLLFSAGPVELTWAVGSTTVDAIMDCFYPAQRAGDWAPSVASAYSVLDPYSA
jgi:hypothetical protein